MLIRVFGHAIPVLILSACDTMIAERIAIQATPQLEPAPSVPELLNTAHVSLTRCGLADNHVSSYDNTVRWRDPDNLPGLHVAVHKAEAGFRVTLSQDLFGPIGPTAAYRCVQEILRRELEERFGKERLRFEGS